LHDFAGDALAFVVDADARATGVQGLVTFVAFEQFTQVGLRALGQGLQGLPGLAFVRGDEWSHALDFRQIYWVSWLGRMKLLKPV
jgi:hypothetical protein